MSYVTERNGKEIVVQIPKNFVVEEATKFREDLHQWMSKGDKYFILDFVNCDFIDSTGLGVIVSVYKKCKEQNGTLKLKRINPQVMRIFELTRLNQVLDISK